MEPESSSVTEAKWQRRAQVQPANLIHYPLEEEENIPVTS